MAWFFNKAGKAEKTKAGPADGVAANAVGTGILSRLRGGWFTILEPYPGAWQKNDVHYEMNPGNAVTNATVFSCISRISGDVARLPLRLEQKLAGRNAWIEAEKQFPILLKPNQHQTGYEFRERLMIQLLRYGNAYIKLERKNNIVTAMNIVDASKVDVLVAPDGQLFYQLGQYNEAGITPNTAGVYNERDVCHIRINPLECSQYIGISPIMAACNSGMMGETAKLLAGQMMRNASSPRTVINVPGAIDTTKLTEMRDLWVAGHQGSNFGKVGVLSDGCKFEVFQGALFDDSLISAMNAGDSQIAKCFGLSIGILDGNASSGNNVYNVSAEMARYLAHTLARYLTLIEERLQLSLWAEFYNREDLRLKFNVSELLKADPVTALTMARDGVAGGIYTINEGRALQGLPPTAAGDTVYLQQQNYSLEALAKRDQQANPFDPSSWVEPQQPEPQPEPVEPEKAAPAAVKYKLDRVFLNKDDYGPYILKHRIKSEMDAIHCLTLEIAKNHVANKGHQGFVEITYSKETGDHYTAYILKKKYRKANPAVMHAFYDVPKDYKPTLHKLPIKLGKPATVKLDTEEEILEKTVKKEISIFNDLMGMNYRPQVKYKDISKIQYKSVAKKRGPKGVNRVPVTYR